MVVAVLSDHFTVFQVVIVRGHIYYIWLFGKKEMFPAEKPQLELYLQCANEIPN